jgi:hypothetical protein
MKMRLTLLTLTGLLSLVIVATSSSLIQTALAAPTVGPLQFSEAINERLEPQGTSIYFPESNNGVFVTFEFRDLPPGTKLSRIVRVNQQDYNYDNPVFGELQCCPAGGSGRYAFLIVKPSGERDELPGGAYEVAIYSGGLEVARSGFGIRGEGGDDDVETGGGDDPDDFGSSAGVLNPGLENLGADEDDDDNGNDDNDNDDDDDDDDDDD